MGNFTFNSSERLIIKSRFNGAFSNYRFSLSGLKVYGTGNREVVSDNFNGIFSFSGMLSKKFSNEILVFKNEPIEKYKF